MLMSLVYHKFKGASSLFLSFFRDRRRFFWLWSMLHYSDLKGEIAMSRSPFPGMDPYLEAPGLWPDVHTRLINIFAEQLTPLIDYAAPPIPPLSPEDVAWAAALLDQEN